VLLIYITIYVSISYETLMKKYCDNVIVHYVDVCWNVVTYGMYVICVPFI
jgi:hypothetical protein